MNEMHEPACGFIKKAQLNVSTLNITFTRYANGAKMSKCVSSKTTIAIMGRCMCVISIMD